MCIYLKFIFLYIYIGIYIYIYICVYNNAIIFLYIIWPYERRKSCLL